MSVHYLYSRRVIPSRSKTDIQSSKPIGMPGNAQRRMINEGE